MFLQHYFLKKQPFSQSTWSGNICFTGYIIPETIYQQNQEKFL